MAKQLGQYTGHKDDAALIAEAMRIVQIMEDNDVTVDHVRQYSGQKSADFYTKTVDALQRYGKKTRMTGLQLKWLRDIKDQVLEKM